MAGLFVDASAFIALKDTSDRNHQAAAGFYAELFETRTVLVTTSLIFAEVVTWLQRARGFGPDESIAFGRWLRDLAVDVLPGPQGLQLQSLKQVPPPVAARRPFRLVPGSPRVDEAAWRIYEEQSARKVTFADAVSFATMKALRLKEAFAFDWHFQAMGFSVRPG